ncbi:MAG: hypothetical protein JW963_18155 [Anaerolineales bacterium]|nr:hypothetical protein [Anaerolineales bacterium]
MRTTNRSELVRAYFSAWENNERAVLEALLAEGLTFSSPNDDHISVFVMIEA